MVTWGKALEDLVRVSLKVSTLERARIIGQAQVTSASYARHPVKGSVHVMRKWLAVICESETRFYYRWITLAWLCGNVGMVVRYSIQLLNVWRACVLG